MKSGILITKAYFQKRPFLARFGSGLGSGIELRRATVRVRFSVREWVGSTPAPRSDQEVLSARKREQPTAPKIRPANLLGELFSIFVILKSESLAFEISTEQYTFIFYSMTRSSIGTP